MGYFAEILFLIMVYRIDKTTTEEDLKNLLNRIKSERVKSRKANFIEFFGALPNIGDGLEYQKTARNEWV